MAEPLRVLPPCIRAYRAWAPQEPDGNVPRLWASVVCADCAGAMSPRPTLGETGRVLEWPKGRLTGLGYEE